MRFSTVLSLTAATFVSFSSAAPLIGALLAPLALDVLGSTGPGKEIIGGIKDTTKDILGGVLGGDDKESNETQVVENDNGEVVGQDVSTDLTQTEGIQADPNNLTQAEGVQADPNDLTQAEDLQADPNDLQMAPAVVSDEPSDSETLTGEDTSFADEAQQVPPSTFDRLPENLQDPASELDQAN